MKSRFGLCVHFLLKYSTICATTSDSVLTDFSSASDLAATTKSETLSSGWRQSVFRAKLTSSRSELDNTPSREWA